MSQNLTMSARERIEHLLDDRSFIEIGKTVHARNTDFNMQAKETPSDGVITGYGTIDGGLVYVFSQDAKVLGGSIGEMHAKKIEKIYDLAMKTGAPVIGMYDCAGIRLQEATDALDALGRLYMKMTQASGLIPQYAAVFGRLGGGAAMLAGLSDFTYIVKDGTQLFVNAPNTIDGNNVSKCNTAGAAFQSEMAGNVDAVFEDAEAMIGGLRQLFAMMPGNHMDTMIYDECMDDLNRKTPDIEALADTVWAIRSFADEGCCVELKADYAKEMVTALIKMNGLTCGVVANRTAIFDAEGNEIQKIDAKLTAKGMEKAADFAKFCDAFSIPVITIVNTTGFEATFESEMSLSRNAAKMIHAFADATVPKISLICGESYGSAYLAMNSAHIGADMVFAYPESAIGMMKAELAAKIIYHDEIKDSNDAAALINDKAQAYAMLQNSPEAAAGRGYVDEIIDPEETRQHLIAALEMLYTKRVAGPDKKHSAI